MRRRLGTFSSRRVELVDASSADAAYAAAIRRLARQPQSRATLAQRLARLGYEETAVRAALDRAQEAGYLDDQALADALVHRRRAGHGQTWIRQELRAKGIPASVATAALSEIDGEAEAERALALARRLTRGHPVADRDTLVRRLGPALSRRGFPGRLIHRVLEQLRAEATESIQALKAGS